MANDNNNNRRNQKGYRGKRKDKQKDKKSQGGGIPIDDLKFSIGRNQIENYEKLVKHLANKVQNKYGASMAHILLNEAEYPIQVPVMRTLELIRESDPDTEKAIKLTQNKERELDYKLSVEEHKKESLTYRRNKEKLCGYLKENCTAMMLTKLESEKDYDPKSLDDPLWLLTTIKSKCLVQSGERHPSTNSMN